LQQNYSLDPPKKRKRESEAGEIVWSIKSSSLSRLIENRTTLFAFSEKFHFAALEKMEGEGVVGHISNSQETYRATVTMNRAIQRVLL
jgi:hypothetical protein